MKKLSLTLLTIIACQFLILAQHGKALDGLLAAEKSFAKTSADKSTRTAFLENLADEAILFRQGIVNGKDFWQQAADDQNKLIWSPQFADVSSGGDFGYTTGPFQFFQNRTDEQPVANGHYITVWQKKSGVWKALIDSGVGHQPIDDSGWESTSSVTIVPSKSSETQIKSALQKLEQTLIEEWKQKGATAIAAYLSAEARIYRPMAPPYRKDDVPALLADTSKEFTYSPFAGIAIAPAGDMAFTYGNVDIGVLKAGSKRQLKGYYMRIWKHEKSTGWRIVIDCVSL